MKRFVELIMSLIVTAAAYAIMHIIFVTDLFQWKSELPIYVPTGLAVFTGFIFYFIISSPVAEMLMRKLSQMEDRLTKMNLKELAFSIFGGFIGLVLANLIGLAFRGFGAVGTFIVVLLNFLFGILGIRVARRKKDEVNVRKLQEVLLTTAPVPEEPLVAGRPKILDTSVIIDGRILQSEKNQKLLIEVTRNNLFSVNVEEVDMEFVPFNKFRAAMGAAALAIRKFILEERR